jgi:hypothetical protein
LTHTAPPDVSVLDPALSDVPGRRSFVGAGWFTVIASLMCGLAPMLLIGSTKLGVKAPFAHDDAWRIALLVCVVVGVRFAWVVATHPQRVYEIIFWLFTYVFLGLAPMLQMRTGIYPETIPVLDTSLNLRTMGLIIIASIAFGAGLAMAGNGAKLREKLVNRQHRVYQTAPHRLLALCTGALLFSTFYASKLGLGVLFGDRDTRSAIEASIFPPTINAVVKATATLPLIICFTGLMRWRQERKQQGLSGPTVLPVLVLLMLFTVVNPVSVPRYYAGTAVLSVLAAAGAVRNARRARIFALALAFGLVLGFPYASAARTPETASLADRGGPATVLTSADFDAFDQLNNAIGLVQQEGAQDGRQASGALLFFVPRAIWESKPEDTGPLLAQFRDYKIENLSSPLQAEMYVDGGTFWLIVGMGLFGFAIRKLDLRAALDHTTGSSALSVVLPFYMIIILRGSLLQAMAGLAVLVTTGLFVGGRRVPQPHPTPIPASA